MNPAGSNATTVRNAQVEPPGGDEDALPMAGWLEPPLPQDLILTLLADNVRSRLDNVWSGGLVNLLSEFGYSPGASRVALARVARRHLVSRVKVGRVVHYCLTERTQELFREGDRRIFSLGSDDRAGDTVTVLFHSLPEDLRRERGSLGKRLRFLRFGPVQDGTWIAMGGREDDLLALLDELKVSEHCSVIQGRLVKHSPLQSMLERVWDFDELERRYDRFVEEFGGYIDKAPVDDQAALHVRTQLIHNFRQFPLLDPGGPASRKWTPNRAIAIDIFPTIYRQLEAAAHRHFDAVTSADKAGVR